MATLVFPPQTRAVVHAPAAATKATIASDTPAANARITVTSIAASLTADAAATSGIIALQLRDGPTATGTVVWSVDLVAVTAASGVTLQMSGLNIAMTAGNVATLEFAAAGPGASLEKVSMSFYADNQFA